MRKFLPLIFFAEAFIILWLLDWLKEATFGSNSLPYQIVYFLAAGVWFFLPAWIANGPPVLVQDYPILDVPIDSQKKWRDGKRILGDHKTVRGFIVGMLGGLFVGVLQGRALEGLVLGFSGMLGDSVKSFFKRRTDIPPGGKYVPWDRIDFLLGALAVYSLAFGFRLEILRHALAILLLVYPVHEISDRVGVRLGVKENPW